MPLENGFVLANRYRIEETIAVGGMGAIYRAIDETFGIPVAVKENFYTSSDYSLQFRSEATILATVRHPSLPRVTNHFVIPEQGQYLVMDYVEGEDLRQIIARHGLLPEADALRIGAEMCDALAYLHARVPPIVHRDIKPGNIKITSTGHATLVDFGLAKFAHGDITAAGAQALTPGYAPPEQYGQGTEPRSDLYALGATLYAVLTGLIPEDGLSRMLGTVQLTPLRKHNPAVSEQTAQVIEKAMAVRPDDRFASALEMKAAIEHALEPLRSQKPVVVPLTAAGAAGAAGPARSYPAPAARGPAPTARGTGQIHAGAAPTPPRRSVAPLTLLLRLAGLLLIAGLALTETFLRNGRPAVALPWFADTQTAAPQATKTPTSAQPTSTLAAMLPSHTPQPTSTHTPVPPTLTATIAATPAGGGSGQIAFASNRSGIPQIWLVSANGADPRQVTNMADGACQPAWSPDGSQLVFISPCAGFQTSYPGASLFIIQADGSGLLPLVSLPGGDYDPDWSPDGKQIAFTSLREGWPRIYRYTLDDNTVIRLSPLPNYEQQPKWSPDGTRIAYQTTRSGTPQVWIMAADGSGARQFSNQDHGHAFSPAWSPAGDVLAFTQAVNQRWLVARQVDNPAAGEVKVNEALRHVFDPDFSPDGFWLGMAVNQDDNYDIYRIRPNGGSLTRLTDDPAVDFHPAWRP